LCSTSELETQLIIAKELGFIDDYNLQHSIKIENIKKMLTGFRNYKKRKK